MTKKEIVQNYLEGFRTGDSKRVLECLSDNVVWHLHGCETFHGKAAFKANITNDEFRELPKLEIQELIEEGMRVVAVGTGAVELDSGTERAFNFTEIFLFQDGLIIEVDTFHVWNDEVQKSQSKPLSQPKSR